MPKANVKHDGELLDSWGRRNRYITFRNKTLCISDWANRFGIGPQVLCSRLNRGWNFEKALTSPVKEYRK